MNYKRVQKFTRLFVSILTVITLLVSPVMGVEPVFAEDPDNPFVQASLVHDWISGFNFSSGSSVNVTIYDSQGGTIYGTSTYPVDSGSNFNINREDTHVDLVPGMRIAVQDNGLQLTKELTLENMTLESVDYEQDTISGTAPSNRDLTARAGNQQNGYSVDVTSDQDGNWSADFKTLPFDLTPDMWFNATLEDADGDETFTEPPDPMYIEAGLTNGWIHVNNFSPNGMVTLGVESSTWQKQADPNGFVDFTPQDIHLALSPGMTIEAEDEATGRTMQMVVEDLRMDPVDYGNSTVSGEAPNGAGVRVEVGDSQGSSRMDVTASETDGSWLADFTQNGVTLKFDQWINARVFDVNGNSTIVEPPPMPVIEASPVYDWINMRGFPTDSQATVSIYSSGGDPLFEGEVEINQDGDGRLDSGRTHFDLTATMQISASVSSPSILKELVLANLSQGEMDPDADEVRGTADPNVALKVTVYGQNYGEAWTQADANGDWTADFGALDIDIVSDMQANIRHYDLDGDSTFVEPPPLPHLDMWVDSNSVSGYDWPIGASLTLTIIDSQDGTYTDTQVNGTAPWSPGSGFYQFYLGDAFTLKPGQQVSITDGTTTRSSVVENLLPPTIDVENSRISGTAAVGAGIWSNICNRDGCANRWVTVGPTGTYVIDFGVPGSNPGEEQVIALYPNDGSSLNWADGYGNNTSLNWHIWNPNINANAGGRWVHGHDWPKGETLTLTVNDIEVGTAVMAQAPWNPNDPNDILAIFDNVSMQVGDELVLSDPDGSLVKSLVLSPIQVTEINVANSTVSGTTNPDARLQVCVNTPEGCAMRYLQADSQGDWTASFATLGSNEGDTGTVTFALGVQGWAADWDADGDQTNVDWDLRVPIVTANVQGHWVQSREWPRDTVLNLEINDVPAGSAVVEQAPWNPGDPNDILAIFNLDPSVSMEVGDTVTVSNADESISKSLLLTSLEITNIDQLAATISGTAAPDTWLQVCINSPQGCLMRNVQADENGLWTADFSVPGSHEGDSGQTSTIEAGRDGWVAVSDDDGDQTWMDWSLPNPHMDVWLDTNAVAAYQWPIGESLTLTVSMESGQPYTDTVTNGQAPWNPTEGFYYFTLPEEFSLTPGQQVTISDGITTRTTTIKNLGVPDVDAANSRITGTAEEGAHLWSCIDIPGSCILRTVTVDASGVYVLDFSIPGSNPDEQQTYTFHPGVSGTVNWSDEQGSNTSINWSVPNYSLHVTPHDQEVHGHDWPLGDLVTITLDDPDTSAHQTASQTVIDDPDQCGMPCFMMGDIGDNGWTLAEGQIVTMSNGALTKTVTVSSLNITKVDALHNQLAGMAGPDSELVVNIGSMNGLSRHTQADSSGNWMVDFSVPGTLDYEQDTADLTAGDWGRVLQLNPGGNNDDGTLQYWGAQDPILLSAVDIDENAPGGSVVGTFSAVFPDAGQVLVYSLASGAGDADNAAFTIDGSALRINASPDYETRDSYSVRVRVVDTQAPGLSFEQTYTITVNDLNEAPTTLSLSASSIDEGAPAGSTIGTFSTTDPDEGQTYAYSLAAGIGDTDNNAFTIGGNTLTINASPDFEVQSSYEIRVRVTDNGDPALWTEETFTITINNVDENATDIQLTSSSVNENVAAGSPIGTLSATGAGAGQEFLFSLVAGAGSTDNAAFTITGNILSINASPNFEAKPSYNIRVRATDSQNASLTVDKEFTITVINLNEAPTAIALSASSINENIPAGSTVGTFSATDPDNGQSATYTLAAGFGDTDNSAFTISGAALSINASPNYEAKTSYTIRVRVTDNGTPGLTFERTFTITINNLNEAPTSLGITTTSMNENIPAGSVVADFTVSDPDVGQTYTYSLVTGIGDADNAAFSITNGRLSINASPNYETKTGYNLRVRVTDNGSPAQSLDQAFTLTVNNLNEAPTNIMLSASSITENAPAGSTVGTLSTGDPDSGQTFTYNLVAGAGSTDNAAFTISGNTLTINASPNFEAKASYSIRVRTTDSGTPVLTFDKIFAITVSNANEVPATLTLSAASINENVAAGSQVGTFSATDPDLPAQSFTYSLAAGTGSTDNAAFTITGNTLSINASPDYEAKSSYAIRVRVTDSGAPAQWLEQTFSIIVNDVNDRPASLELSSSIIAENAPAGSRTIGNLSATDPDLPTQSFTYGLVNGSGSADNAAFIVNGSTLSIKAAPDYETKPNYSIRVRVTDSGTPTQFLERIFTVTVTNLVEQPIVTSFNKSGLQDTTLPFAASDFTEHFVDLESTGTGILEKIKITELPTHGALKVGGVTLTTNSEVLAANLGQLVYVPEPNFSGSDTFSWNGADNTGYAGSSAQVFLTVGFVAKYGLQVSPVGDAKSAKVGTTAVYTLSLTNTGNVTDSYSIALEGAPTWTTTFTPAQVTNLPASAQTTLGISVAIPSSASGSDEAVLRITSKTDATKTVSVKLTTTAISAPVAPSPVLLGVSPASVNISAIQTAQLTLSGSNFTDPMTVRVGGVLSPLVTRNSSAELLAPVPTGLQPGVYTVQVCNASAKCASLPDAFTVLDNTPSISGVYPSQGYNDAPNSIIIQGYNLTASTSFTLVGAGPEKQPTGVNLSGGQLQATIPAGLAAGTYDMQACNQSLCSTLVSAYTALDVIKNDFSAANEDLWTAPATIREGNTILVGLNVHRPSGMGLSSVQVSFYRDDPSVPANKISPDTNPSTSLMASGSVEAVTAAWTPVGLTGAVKIYAVIDPDGLLTEATKANNIVSTTIQILPREERDETAPVINSLTINGGADATGQKQVNLSLQAADNAGGSGIQTMNLVEREYNTSARQWVVVQETGWIAYQSNFQLTLSDQGGLHYIQVWVADGAGNTSEMAQARINYEPPQDAIAAGQVRVYRLELTAGQEHHIVLETLTGDSDLYVWDPDGNLVASSITAETIDRVDFTPRVSGLYQVEVYGYEDSTYSIDFQASALSTDMAGTLPLFEALDKTPRSQPTIVTQNEPLKNIPTDSAPIAAEPDGYFVFLPVIVRQ